MLFFILNFFSEFLRHGPYQIICLLFEKFKVSFSIKSTTHISEAVLHIDFEIREIVYERIEAIR